MEAEDQCKPRHDEEWGHPIANAIRVDKFNAEPNTREADKDVDNVASGDHQGLARQDSLQFSKSGN